MTSSTLITEHFNKKLLEIVNTPIIPERYSIIEVLDSENVSSKIDDWKNECSKFKEWCVKVGIDTSNKLEMAKAYNKIEA